MSVLAIPDLAAGFLLDEESGLVARNVVRTLVYDETFDNVASTDQYGDLPAGGITYIFSNEGSEIASRAISGSTLAISYENDGTADTDYFGYRVISPGFVSGRNYVAEFSGRVLSKAGSSRVRFYAETWHNVTESDDLPGEFSAAVPFVYSGSFGFALAAAVFAAADAISFEVDRIRVYEETAGTYARDASNTHADVSAFGAIRDAQEFNGTSDCVAIDGLQDFAGEFTLATWARIDGVPVSNGRFFSSRDGSGNGVDFYVQTDGQIRYYSTGGAPASPAGTFEFDGELHHVAISVRSSGWSMFYDGRPVANGLADLRAIATASLFYLGRVGSSASAFLAGGLASPLIFARALAGYEIAQIVAEGPLAQLDVARIAYWRLDETSGNVVRATPRETTFVDLFDTAGAGPPSGWSSYVYGHDGDEVFSQSVADGVWSIVFDAGTAGTDNYGASRNIGLVSGDPYVAKVICRATAKTGTCGLVLNLGGSNQQSVIPSVGDWQTFYLSGTAAGGSSLYVSIYAAAGASMALEIASIEIMREHAGKSIADLSTMTVAGVLPGSGRGLEFNGTSDAIDLPYALCLDLASLDEVTVAFLYQGTEPQSAVRIQPAAASFFIVPHKSSGSYFVALSSAGGAEQFSLGDGSDFADGAPHSCVYTYQRNTTNGQKWYVDGVLAAQANAPDAALPSFSTSSIPARLGAYGSGSAYLAGVLDEVSLAARAWSAAEVVQFHTALALPPAIAAAPQSFGLSLGLQL